MNLFHPTRIKLLRRVLLAVIVVMILAVTIDYFQGWLKRNHEVEEPPGILSEEMVRSAETIEYIEHRAGEPQFELRANKLLETREGRNLLEGIEAQDYNPDGSVRNLIRSKEAEYDREGKQAFFNRDVKIEIGDKYRLEMNSLHYDLARNVGETDDLVRLISPRAKGSATGIRYNAEQKVLELKRNIDFEFEVPAAIGGQDGSHELYQIRANHGHYSESRQEMLFSGDARMDSNTARLSGDEIQVRLSNDGKKIMAISCQGNAVYKSELDREVRQLRGDRMLFSLDPESIGLHSIDVMGKAGLIQSSQSVIQELEASELRLAFERPAGTLKSVAARSVDRFNIVSNAGNTTVTAGDLQLEFTPGRSTPERMVLRGSSRVTMGNEGEKRAEQLSADEIRITFGLVRELLTLRRIEALRGVEWISFEPTVDYPASSPGRSLTTDHLTMSYDASSSYLESGLASGNVVITLLPIESASESSSGLAVSSLRCLQSEQVQFFFYPDSNQLKEFTGQGNVEIDYQVSASEEQTGYNRDFHTSSSHFKAVFTEEKGAIGSVSQWGGFEYQDNLRTISADHCEYQSVSNSLLLEGSPCITDDISATSGLTMVYDRDLQILTVQDQVRSVLTAQVSPNSIIASSDRASSPSIITAHKMAYFVERSQVQYDGNVQLLAESGQLQADTLILSDSGESVEARGSVNHLILARHESYNQSGDGSSVGVEAEPTIPSGHVQVRSKRLDYLQKEAMIRYSGGVVLSYGDTIMSSEVVDAIMDHTGKRVERATAQGKINIQQDGREVKGERAEYFLEPGKFVVTGKSAQIYDPTRGRSFASRLTFFTSSDRILLDDGSGALRD